MPCDLGGKADADDVLQRYLPVAAAVTAAVTAAAAATITAAFAFAAAIAAIAATITAVTTASATAAEEEQVVSTMGIRRIRPDSSSP